MKDKATSPATPNSANGTAHVPVGTYELVTLNSGEIELPPDKFQSNLNKKKVANIAAYFDEHLANEPKVAAIDGHYYVYDGRHTIAARMKMNGGNDVDVLCKVYYGLTEESAKNLFNKRTGASTNLTLGEISWARMSLRNLKQ